MRPTTARPLFPTTTPLLGGPPLHRGLLILMVLMLISQPAQAQEPVQCEDAITTARDQFLRGGFGEARILLEACLAQNAFSDAEKPEVYKLLVRIYDASDLEEQVKRFLAALFALVPNYEPDPSDPPSFIQLVEQFKSEINQVPAAQLTFVPTTGEAPLSVRFDASASVDADGTIASYAWDFGDGTAGNGVTVNHTYQTAGTYTVRLTVADADGALSAATAAIAVTERPNEAPVARIAATPQTGEAPVTVRFDASGSSDADGTVASHAWDFGDGSTGNGATVSHTFEAAGTYEVELTVADDDGASHAVTETLIVTERPNEAPVARLAANPQTGEAPLSVQFDASGSSDADGTIASYAWDLGDGNTGTGVTVSHTYQTAGAYEVELTVADDDGASHAVTETIAVTERPNEAPVARIAATPQTGEAPLSVRLDGSASSDADGTVATYAWDFGDGNTGNGATVNHTYEAAGTYEVELRVADDDGSPHVVTETIAVTERPNAAPVARIAATPQTGEAPLSVRLDGSASSDADGMVASYAWEFGDGSTGNGATVSHTFEAAGTYEVQLTVADADGATHAVTETIAVTARPNQAPVARIVAIPTGGEAPVTVRLDGSASSDADGTVASYAWEFGDGSTGNGVRTSHAYLTAGTYEVELTVIDDDGARATASERIRVTPPATAATPRRRSGMRKWLLIGGGAVLAGTLGVVLSSGGGSDEPPPPPPAAGIPIPPGRPGGN